MGELGAGCGHRFRIDRLVVVSRSGDVWFDEQFHDGINVIYGLNESGKTPLLLLIRRALGMEAEYKDQLRQQLARMELYFTIDSRSFFTVYYFEGQEWTLFETSPGGTMPQLAAATQESIQAFIMERLGLASEQVPDSTSKSGFKTVGLANFFSAWYVNQKTGYNTIINDHDQKVRRIAFESLMALDLSAARTRLGFLEQIMDQQLSELAKEERHYQTVKYKLQLSDEAELHKEIASEKELLHQLESQYALLRQVDVPASEMDVAKGLRTQLEDTQRRINAKTFERSSLHEALANSKADKRVLDGRLKELNQVTVAEDILSSFSFTQCPRCTQPISSHMMKREDTDPAQCMLCGRDLPAVSDDAGLEITRERQRLEEELSLQVANIKTYERQLKICDDDLAALQAKADNLRDQLSRLTNVSLQPKLESLTETQTRLEGSRMRLYQLELKAKFRELLQPVEAKISELKRQVSDAKNDFQALQVSEQGAQWQKLEHQRLKLFTEENQKFIDAAFRDARSFSMEPTGSRIYMPRLNGEPFNRLNANEPYRVVIAYYLAMLGVSLQHETRFPRFLIFDTPRQQDADPEVFEGIVSAIRSVQERFGSALQIIITGSDEAVVTAASSFQHVITVPKGKKILRPKETMSQGGNESD